MNTTTEKHPGHFDTCSNLRTTGLESRYRAFIRASEAKAGKCGQSASKFISGTILDSILLYPT